MSKSDSAEQEPAKLKNTKPKLGNNHGFGVMPRLIFGLTVVGILVVGIGG